MSSQDTDRQITEERLRRALRGGQIVAWEWDLETGHLTWSDNVLEVLGWSSDRAKDFDDRVHPDDQERHQAALQRTFSGSTPYDVEVRFIKPDKTVIWIHDKAELQADENNRRILTGITIDITARKWAEAAAQDKAAILEVTLENIDQGLIMVDADETVQVYNKKVLDLLELPEEIMRGPQSYERIKQHQREHGEFVQSDAQQRHWLHTGNFLESVVQYERERPNGTVLEVRSIPLPSGGAVRTFTDISSRRKAETELIQSAERYRLVMRATNDAVWDWDLPNDTISWNEAVRTLFGYSEQDVDPSGTWWKERIHPDDRERVVSGIQAVIDGQPVHWTDEYRFRRADGSYADVLDRGYMIRGRNGQPYRMVGAMLDQTARKIAQADLQESERKYRLLAENTGDMIVLTGPDKVRRYVSPASREVIGYEPDELLSMTGPDQTHPDDVAWVTAQFDDMFARRLPATVASYRLQHKDGSWVSVEARRRLILDENGNPEAILSAIRDISERVKLEEQLRQAQKMEAVGQLTGGIAHDFNNLLTVIAGNAELLVEAPSDPDLTRSLAGIILQAAEKGSDLTQRLLAFGRRQTLTPERLDLDQVVERIGSLLRRTLSANIEIVTELQEADFAALTDRTLLESAILNMVVNARDAMPQGGTLTIRTGDRIATLNDGSIPVGQPVVFVSISDTGTGMSPEVLARVFEPFYTTKAVGKGSGLGLAMVHGFAEQAGGHVSIESALDQGTTVTILLPAIDKLSLQASAENEVAEAPQGGGRVLVVEDEPQVLHLVCSQLAHLGYRIEAVAAGPDALDVLREDQSFDLLFTDVVMPKGMSGIELAKYAREIKPDLRVLLTSGYPEEVFQEHGSPEEDMPLLRKPYKRKELADALRKVLE